MYSYEIFIMETGSFGYRILNNESPIIVQEFHPDKDGFEPMTEEQANECAKIVLDRVTDKPLAEEV